MSLFSADIGREIIITVLRARHQEHLAKLERQWDLTERTLEPLKTIDHLAGNGFLAEDTPPAVLVGMSGTTNATLAPSRDRTANQPLAYNLTWDLRLALLVVGNSRKDALKRLDWYAMTLVECVLQRVPLDQQIIDSIAFIGIQPQNAAGEARARTTAETEIQFSLSTMQAVSTVGLPRDNTTLTPGTPGGAPAAPYDTPVPWPTATIVPADVDEAS